MEPVLKTGAALVVAVGSNPTLSAISFLDSVTISLDNTYNLR